MLSRFLLVSALCVRVLAASAAPMEFRIEGNGGNCDGCEWILADGEITAETPAKFAEFIQKELKDQSGGEIRLNSPGGSLVAGIKLGQLLRKHKFSTSVGSSKLSDGLEWQREREKGKCVSACALAFIGGISRSVEENELGVHQFYRDAAFDAPRAKLFDAIDLSNEQIITGIMLEYTTRMGVRPEFVFKAATTPPSSMYYFSSEDLANYNIRWNPAQYKPWAIEPYGSGVIAFSKTFDDTETLTILCRSDKLLRFVISRKLEKPDDTGFSLDYVDGADLFGRPVAKADMSTFIRSGSAHLQVILRNLEVLRTETTKLELQFDVTNYAPHAAWWGLNRTFTSKNLIKSIQIARRNCI